MMYKSWRQKANTREDWESVVKGLKMLRQPYNQGVSMPYNGIHTIGSNI